MEIQKAHFDMQMDNLEASKDFIPGTFGGFGKGRKELLKEWAQIEKEKALKKELEDTLSSSITKMQETRLSKL
jgi:hypothetical protein